MNIREVNIYIADSIDKSGIKLLKDKGFNVYSLTGLSNNDLFGKISVKDSKFDNLSVLIIRSVRNIKQEDIDILKSKTKIKCICTASSGFDKIDSIYAKKQGIKVINVPNGNYLSAAEHTISLILYIIKNLKYSEESLSGDSFYLKEYSNTELYKKTIGIIGVGRVGSYLAKLCRAFNMKILGNDIKKSLKNKYPWIHFCDLNYLSSHSDIVTVHTPLDDSTRNMIDANFITRMKTNSILVNCARGGIIDEKALINKLKSNKLFYSALDVFENEPDVNPEFFKLKNIVITPHQAGKTRESKVRISILLAQKLIKELEKKTKT